ncbi:MAG: DUF2301 domain-containing membrane protein [Nitrospirota bacterium]
MGERVIYQPLTPGDRLTVVLYRAGIVLAALIIAAAAFLMNLGEQVPYNLLLYGVYGSAALSVFFIHLYIGKLKRLLMACYAAALGALGLLLALGGGDPALYIAAHPQGLLLLLPVSFCLGFATAKEAFCFQLPEGYLLAIVMPLFLLVLSTGQVGTRGASYGLFVITGMYLYFLVRKLFMPLAYDIGDKSAYQ